LSIFNPSTGGAAAASGPQPFTYPSQRCSVPLKGIITDLVNGSLSSEVFPSAPGQVVLAATAKPAAQSTRKNQGWNSKKAPFVGGKHTLSLFYWDVQDARFFLCPFLIHEIQKRECCIFTHIITNETMNREKYRVHGWWIDAC
jgi:hypothetical protein